MSGAVCSARHSYTKSAGTLWALDLACLPKLAASQNPQYLYKVLWHQLQYAACDTPRNQVNVCAHVRAGSCLAPEAEEGWAGGRGSRALSQELRKEAGGCLLWTYAQLRGDRGTGDKMPTLWKQLSSLETSSSPF